MIKSDGIIIPAHLCFSKSLDFEKHKCAASFLEKSCWIFPKSEQVGLLRARGKDENGGAAGDGLFSLPFKVMKIVQFGKAKVVTQLKGGTPLIGLPELAQKGVFSTGIRQETIICYWPKLKEKGETPFPLIWMGRGRENGQKERKQVFGWQQKEVRFEI